jgi:hypothetical protein
MTLHRIRFSLSSQLAGVIDFPATRLNPGRQAHLAIAGIVAENLVAQFVPVWVFCKARD